VSWIRGRQTWRNTKFRVTPPTWMPLFPPQPVSSAHALAQPRHAATLQIGESHRGNEQLRTGNMTTAQDRKQDLLGHAQEDCGAGQPARVISHGESHRIKDPADRPVRQRKSNMRYPLTEFNLNSVRTRSRRTIRRATLDGDVCTLWRRENILGTSAD
jgi:hypothetical protein